MGVTTAYNFIRFGAMGVTKPYKFVRFGAMDITKLYEFIGLGAPLSVLCGWRKRHPATTQ